MLRVVRQNSSSDERLAHQLTTGPVSWGEGFFGEETDDGRAFRWMGLEAQFDFIPADEARFLEVSAYCSFHDLSQVLTATSGAATANFELTPGWMQLSIEVPAEAKTCTLSLNRPFPRAFYPDDVRTLGVQLREPRLHTDPDRHAHVARQHANARHNRAEMLQGKSRLESTPPVLGIDPYGVCNVKPPCVYCEWDWAKDLEGDNVDAPFDLDTLASYGEFYDNSHRLVSCSIGEPFMMKNIDEILESFGRQGKILELTTNGQILTDRNIDRLVGRSVDLYISLDAGTPETYSKLRNERFEDILSNLRRLNKAKGGRAGLPRIQLVFMPMKVNQHELEDFVRICSDLEADRMVLRPLNYSDSVDLTWQRAGYTFDYREELLPFERLQEISAEAARLAAQYRVTLADQMDFGGESQSFADSSDGYPAQGPEVSSSAQAPVEAVAAPTPPDRTEESSESLVEATESVVAELSAEEAPVPEEALPRLGADAEPLCHEPWRSLYILRRGTMPCCYGGHPVAGFDDYREAWNGPEIVEIRESLAAGRFPEYCLNSPACPIVRKQQESGELPWSQRALLAARRNWFAFERATDEGWRRPLAWPVRRSVRLAWSAVSRLRNR